MPTAADRPAVLGGSPVRAGGEATWPVPDERIAAVLQELATSGEWGRYLGPHVEALRERLAALHSGPPTPEPHADAGDADIDPAAVPVDEVPVDEVPGDEVPVDEVQVELCGSGTAAVWLALQAVGVREGDEVLLAGYDFKANLGNVRSLGARPVLVDVRADDAQLDVAGIEPALTPRTRAVLVSHLHGGSVRMRPLRALAEAREFAIVEDVCQNPLARVDGRLAGRWGDAAAFSFGGSKTLSAGRGGAVVTTDAAAAQRLRRINDRGNLLSPLSEMQAAVLLPQLDRLPERAARRREAAAYLAEHLPPLGLVPLPTREAEGCEPDFYKVGLWYDAAAVGLSRERYCQAMHAENITLSPGFPSLAGTHARRTFAVPPEGLPHSERAGRTLTTLHHPILLEGESGWQQIVEAAARVKTHAAAIAAGS